VRRQWVVGMTRSPATRENQRGHAHASTLWRNRVMRVRSPGRNRKRDEPWPPITTMEGSGEDDEGGAFGIGILLSCSSKGTGNIMASGDEGSRCFEGCQGKVSSLVISCPARTSTGKVTRDGEVGATHCCVTPSQPVRQMGHRSVMAPRRCFKSIGGWLAISSAVRTGWSNVTIRSSRPGCCTGTAIQVDGGLVRFPL
jgi:hypothetical protein